METLIYCLDILNIKEDTEIYRKALELQEESVNQSNEWISAMKIIANAQLSDFLTLSSRAIEGKKMSNVILKMYRDILENYDSLKSNYPRIIVDVISILNKGVDTKGSRVNPINIEKYYQSRKQQATITEEEEQKEETAAATSTSTAAAAINKEKILLSKKDLVERLSQITKRDRKVIEESLAKLQESDVKKISELCHNYSRIEYYSKLITNKGSQEQFKNEIQRELGRKPRSHQLGRAITSVKRVRTYIENILDNKFIPDASHGINHVKQVNILSLFTINIRLGISP